VRVAAERRIEITPEERRSQEYRGAADRERVLAGSDVACPRKSSRTRQTSRCYRRFGDGSSDKSRTTGQSFVRRAAQRPLTLRQIVSQRVSKFLKLPVIAHRRHRVFASAGSAPGGTVRGPPILESNSSRISRSVSPWSCACLMNRMRSQRSWRIETKTARRATRARHQAEPLVVAQGVPAQPALRRQFADPKRWWFAHNVSLSIHRGAHSIVKILRHAHTPLDSGARSTVDTPARGRPMSNCCCPPKAEPAATSPCRSVAHEDRRSRRSRARRGGFGFRRTTAVRHRATSSRSIHRGARTRVKRRVCVPQNLDYGVRSTVDTEPRRCERTTTVRIGRTVGAERVEPGRPALLRAARPDAARASHVGRFFVSIRQERWTASDSSSRRNSWAHAARDSRAVGIPGSAGPRTVPPGAEPADAKLDDVDARLQQLQEFRHTLRDYLSRVSGRWAARRTKTVPSCATCLTSRRRSDDSNRDVWRVLETSGDHAHVGTRKNPFTISCSSIFLRPPFFWRDLDASLGGDAHVGRPTGPGSRLLRNV